MKGETMPRYIIERHAQEAMSTLICDCLRDKRIPNYEDVKDALLTCPTADVVEVVRCKNCKHRDADDFCAGRGYPNALVPDDGFCDKGERGEE